MRADNGNRWPDSGDVEPPQRVPLRLRDKLILALLAAGCATAIGVLVAWATGDTSGIVADKRVVQKTVCRDGCRLETCHQITYVTDDGHRRELCVPPGRYDAIDLGDRISG
ncbi:hypothetical protein [Micromonospora auratinigra]|uniref:Uncharacterized protein n=1 Tax=Micromonospora auratinigra TaxID=261654 RepID=A0A1A8ZB68_9ACTN|nr:hypothetical protein [Micromonospora auratinigra]SBT41082.1 hypothetical protein GA0070611_1491 [Micromonospora auratinigra]